MLKVPFNSTWREKRKEKKEQTYRDKDKYWERHSKNMMKERDGEKEKHRKGN